MTWKLQAITGEFTGQEIAITDDFLVGRHQDADLVLQAAEVSRKHAALLLKMQQLWVQDLGSSNGTFVNDLRIEQETQLHEGDIVQFASFKFSVLAPADQNTDLPEVQAESIKQAHQQAEEAPEKTPAEQMTDAGMPSLTERAADTAVSREGMPSNMGVPKPAPIPEHVEVKAHAEPEPVIIAEKTTPVEPPQDEQKKNASVGLITMIVLIILAVLAWMYFK